MLTEEHYQQLLGLRSPWSVTNVELDMKKMRVDIHVENIGQTDTCPECGASCRIYDEAAERTGGIWTPCSLKRFCMRKLREWSVKNTV